MRAQRLPAVSGLAWIRDGFRLWQRNPALLTFVTFAYLLMFLLLLSIPRIGPIALLILMPGLSLGVMNAVRAVALGRKGGPELVFSGFRMNPKELLSVGGLYLVGSFLVFGALYLVGDGVLVDIFSRKVTVDEAVATHPALWVSQLIVAALSTLLNMAYWYAPVLAGWFEVPAAKAVFFSFVACLINWRAFLAYSVGLFALAFLFTNLYAVLITAISSSVSALAFVPLMAFMILCIPILFATFYPTVRDVFGEPGQAPDEAR